MKKVFYALLSAVVLVASVYLLGLLVEPKFNEGVRDGAMIREYYGSDFDHDMVFIGDCEVYENFSPVVLNEEYGIKSYVRGSPNQLVWQSYYLLEDTYLHETPKYVVFNVRALKNDIADTETYNRMTLDGMKWSKYKVAAINESLMEGESFLSYVFPLLRYHSRITELSGDDFRYMFNRPTVTWDGYLPNYEVVPAKRLPNKNPLADYSLDERCMEYLDKIRLACDEHGSTLVLIKSPCEYPYYYDEWNEQIVTYALEHNLDFYNFMGQPGVKDGEIVEGYTPEEIGIDFDQDSYDGGPHLNIYGAEKLSRFFGKVFSEDYSI